MTSTRRWLGLAAALGGPVLLTVILVNLHNGQPREYVFLYLALVAILGVGAGLAPALLAAAASFLLVDWYFVPPVHTLSFADSTDLVNLTVFFGAAGLVGGLGSRRRSAQLAAEALAAQLRAANIQLERLSREQAEAATTAVRLAQTQQQVRALQEADRLRRELLANVSHELRTPLASILTGTTALSARPSLTEADREDINTVAEEARRLNRLVADMLDLARIEGGALELRLEPIEIAAVIDAAAQRLRQRAPGRAILVEAPRTLDVVADWDRLGQVFDNLLLNADRFAPDGTPIEVRAVMGANGLAVVRVIDHGPGVDPALGSKVFERFVGDGAMGGSIGLGLAVARGLIEAHAGRIWLEESGSGEGGRFAFSLPVATPQDAEPA
ncbi:MAG TPA: ATP-binding protein [Candidatus Dormibacteraeota bacterium]